MAKEQQQGLGALSSILAKNLNEIEDLPNYIAPPAGVYKLLIKACGQKIINEKTVIAVDYVFLELKSLNDNADEADKEEVAKIQWAKDQMSEVFYFNDPDRIETTLGVLKKKYGPFGPTLGTTNLLEIMEKLPNLTVDAQLGRRKDDNDSTKFYPYTRTLVLAV